MTAWLGQEGDPVKEKRGRRLWRQMGLMAVYPQPHLSYPCAGGQRYPSFLTGVKSDRSDHVWATDITYVRLWQGFVSLVAMMDGYRRDVWSWAVSIPVESSFCVSALARALIRAQPALFTADQGAQFTSLALTECLLERRMLIRMDGRGRALDNIVGERLWRRVTDEAVY